MVGGVNIGREPLFAQNLVGHFNHDVVGFQQTRFQVVLIAVQAHQAARAGGQNFDVLLWCSSPALPQDGLTLADLFFLAEANLRGHIRARRGQATTFTTAALAFKDVVADQRLHCFHGCLKFHRAVAGVVVEVATTCRVAKRDAFFQQVFVDINDAATREYLVKLVALQLVVTGAAAHHHGLDVHVVQRIGHAVEQDAVVRDDFFGLVKLTAAALRITAAQVTRRQYGLHPCMPEHGLRCQAHL